MRSVGCNRKRRISVLDFCLLASALIFDLQLLVIRCCLLYPNACTFAIHKFVECFKVCKCVCVCVSAEQWKFILRGTSHGISLFIFQRAKSDYLHWLTL